MEERLRAGCGRASAPRTGRRPRRALRTLLAAAGYAVVRGEALPNLAAAVEALFGDGSRGSTQAREAYDDLGRQTLNLPNRERVALEYADGTSYVVCDRAADLDNTEYALGCGSRPDMTLRLCFNRLVDPARVVSVEVNGRDLPIA